MSVLHMVLVRADYTCCYKSSLLTLEVHNLVHPLRRDAKRTSQLADTFARCIAQTYQLIATTLHGSPEAPNFQQPGDDLGQ